jgi:hypothetical protein
LGCWFCQHRLLGAAAKREFRLFVRKIFGDREKLPLTGFPSMGI